MSVIVEHLFQYESNPGEDGDEIDIWIDIVGDRWLLVKEKGGQYQQVKLPPNFPICGDPSGSEGVMNGG
jgi:hypothetical protein